MLCEVFNCHRPITEGNLVLIKLQKVDNSSSVVQNVNMFVSVCNHCIKEYKYEHKVRGSIKILDTA